MDFQDMEDEELPCVNVQEIITELSEGDNMCPTEENQIKLPPAVDMPAEQVPTNGDSVPVPKLETASPSSSKSKQISVSNEIKNKRIQEFVRVLRPHLPRKSKSKAYKLLQNLAKGIIVESSFQCSSIRKKKSKKRAVRKPKVRNVKTKSLSFMRRSVRSMYESSDSCRSDASCPRCGYSCCRIPRC